MDELRSIAAIMNKTCSSLKLSGIPEDYFVIDLETTGLASYRHKIIQLGYCAVRNKCPDKIGSFILRQDYHTSDNWSETERLTGLSFEKVSALGLDEAVILPAFMDTVKTWVDSGRFIVGHNLINFDIPFLNRHAAMRGSDYEIPLTRALDTGMIVKAARGGIYFDPNDTFFMFAKRTYNVIRKGLFWKLAYCIKDYGLEEKFNGLQYHDAANDCFATHILFEKIREVSEELND